MRVAMRVAMPVAMLMVMLVAMPVAMPMAIWMLEHPAVSFDTVLPTADSTQDTPRLGGPRTASRCALV